MNAQKAMSLLKRLVDPKIWVFALFSEFLHGTHTDRYLTFVLKTDSKINPA
jgi:hypothetical protein